MSPSPASGGNRHKLTAQPIAKNRSVSPCHHAPCSLTKHQFDFVTTNSAHTTFALTASTDLTSTIRSLRSTSMPCRSVSVAIGHPLHIPRSRTETRPVALSKSTNSTLPACKSKPRPHFALKNVFDSFLWISYYRYHTMKQDSIIHEHGKLFALHIKILNVPRVHLLF